MNPRPWEVGATRKSLKSLGAILGLRSAMGRAIVASAFLVLVLSGLVALAVWHTRGDRTARHSLERRAAVVAVINDLRAQYLLAASKMAVAAFTEDRSSLMEELGRIMALATADEDIAEAQLVALGDTDGLVKLQACRNITDEVMESAGGYFAAVSDPSTDSVAEMAREYNDRLWPAAENLFVELEALASDQQAKLTAERSAADAAENGNLAGLVALSVLALIAGMASLMVLGLSVLRPLGRLRRTIREAALGRGVVSASVSGSEEVASLARDFNAMIAARREAEEALRQAKEELESRVAERTEQIRASLEEKEVLLKEIHHRVKNNLQVISSLLNLQAARADDGQTGEVFRDSQNRIRSMALVHEKLYRAEDVARIDFSDYARTLAEALFRSYGAGEQGIELKVDDGGVYLTVDKAAPCGLLLNELVSNSLKHAFPGGRGGQVHVGLRPDGDGRLTLSVGDDGVGFPEELDFRKTTSLGLQLVSALAGQLEGTVELDRSRGTEFKVTFQQGAGKEV